MGPDEKPGAGRSSLLNPGSGHGVRMGFRGDARTCRARPPSRPAPGRLVLVGAHLLAFLAFPSAAAPQIRFSDQAEAAGVTALNVFGGMEKRYILEAHGSGAGFFDSDNDGDLDLYLVNGATFETWEERSGPGNSLYRNNGDGTFSDVAAAAGVDDAGWGAGCAVGDIDNDGDRDLYVTNYRANLLYGNRGDGTFADLTADAGVAGDDYSAGAAFFDYDNDGDLDLYVANYLRFDLRDNPRVDCDYVGGIKTYCGPLGMEGAADVLYRNDGGGRFADVTASSGVGASAVYFGLGVLPGDFDGDGLVDLYVANDQTPNLLFRNRGDGTFGESGLVSGVAYSGDGDEEAGMGVDSGDFDGDGDPDLYVTNFFRESNTLYRNEGGGRFSDYTVQADLEAVTLTMLGWGTAFSDLDNDGDLDLFVANGHVFPEVDDAPTGTSYRQKNQVFRNDGSGFADVSAAAGPGLKVDKVSRGASFGDYDEDGDVDVLVVNLNDTPTLLRNDRQEGNCLVVEVEGTKSNRDGAGAEIRVRAGDRTRVRVVDSSGSYLSASDIRAHFGLGALEAVESVAVRWPDGSEQTVGAVPANRLLFVRQGAEPEIGELKGLRGSGRSGEAVPGEAPDGSRQR